LTRIYEEHYRLLINVAEQAERGFLVTSVDSRSPTANMVKVGNPKVHGSLEPGDIITHVNGHAIRGLASLHDALDQAGAVVTLTVIDKSSSQEINWQTKTVKVQTPIIPGEDHPPTRDRVVRVLLIGLTDDERIGKGMQLNLTNLERILRSEIPGERWILRSCRVPIAMPGRSSVRSENSVAGRRRQTPSSAIMRAMGPMIPGMRLATRRADTSSPSRAATCCGKRCSTTCWPNQDA